jgi:hypothetical protein
MSSLLRDKMKNTSIIRLKKARGDKPRNVLIMRVSWKFGKPLNMAESVI